jgi:hypothetical protein
MDGPISRDRKRATKGRRRPPAAAVIVRCWFGSYREAALHKSALPGDGGTGFRKSGFSGDCRAGGPGVRARTRARGGHGRHTRQNPSRTSRARSPPLATISHPANGKARPSMLDQLRREVQTRLDELVGEADKLRRALAALGSRDGASPPSTSATPSAAPERVSRRAHPAPASRTAIRKPARSRASASAAAGSPLPPRRARPRVRPRPPSFRRSQVAKR